MTHYVIQRQEADTFCEEPHPVRLGRNPEHYSGEPSERAAAIRYGKRGYLCPGGEAHTYPVWIVYDEDNDRASNAGVSDVYREAKDLRDRLNAEVGRT